MNFLCNIINNGLTNHFNYVYIPFKKKFIPILNILQLYSCISNYTILNNKKILINLRYFNGKPVCHLKLISSSGNKVYMKNKTILKSKFYNNTNFTVISSDKFISTPDTFIYKNIGGKMLLQINFFKYL